jgi:transcriptional regulator with XRE-family HTH domain
MTLGSKIQALRKKTHMSQDELADKLGVSRQALSKWENDCTNPDIEKVILISDLFSVTTDYLLKEHQNQNESTFDTFQKNKRLSSSTLIIFSSLIVYLGTLIAIGLSHTSISNPNNVFYTDWTLELGSYFGIALQILGIALFVIMADFNDFKKTIMKRFWLINSWPLSLIPSYVLFVSTLHPFTRYFFNSDQNNTTVLFHLLFILILNVSLSYIIKRKFDLN